MTDAENPGLAWPSSIRLRTERRVSPPNSLLIRAGDAGPRVRVIVTGWAYSYRMLTDGRRQILNVLLPGEAFGLESMFGQPIETSVQSSTALVYLALETEDLVAAFDSSAAFRLSVLRTMIAERSALETSLVRLGQCDAGERTAAFLTSLYVRLERAGLASQNTYRLPITQQEVADLLGLHTIHLNRVLVRLRARKLISIEKKVVTLLDLQGLSDMVPPLTSGGVMPWMVPGPSELPPENGIALPQ